MKLGDILNNERVSALGNDRNAYIEKSNIKSDNKGTSIQSAQKVLFPEAYENASHYYNKNEFSKPSPPEQSPQCEQLKHSCNHNSMPMFDIKSLLPMLMGGNFNDMLKPLMSMFGGKGGGGMDMAKIFEMFKPKSKSKKEEKKEEDISSKFDDMIIIED